MESIATIGARLDAGERCAWSGQRLQARREVFHLPIGEPRLKRPRILQSFALVDAGEQSLVGATDGSRFPTRAPSLMRQKRSLDHLRKGDIPISTTGRQGPACLPPRLSGSTSVALRSAPASVPGVAGVCAVRGNEQSRLPPLAKVKGTRRARLKPCPAARPPLGRHQSSAADRLI